MPVMMPGRGFGRVNRSSRPFSPAFTPALRSEVALLHRRTPSGWPTRARRLKYGDGYGVTVLLLPFQSFGFERCYHNGSTIPVVL
jgi:hypothetical protein